MGNLFIQRIFPKKMGDASKKNRDHTSNNRQIQTYMIPAEGVEVNILHGIEKSNYQQIKFCKHNLNLLFRGCILLYQDGVHRN